MKIKDIIDAIYIDSYVRIGRENEASEYITVWEGYRGDIPNEYLEEEFDCLIPMYDYGPEIGIQLFDNE